MQLTSSAFPNGGTIPSEHSNLRFPGGSNVSLPFAWAGAPPETRSIALLVVDTAPVARGFVHWMVVDLPPGDGKVDSGASTRAMPPGSRELGNSFGTVGYGGPTPPPGTGRHAYEATVFALDIPELGLDQSASLDRFRKAIDGHVLDRATYVGYQGR
ncbi:MAG: YbhB/YbcL family Raf kinase inhibitor-like protein [Coriobacteriales bacterium]|nr:YbhB/YbcL family Raf kinase inhibitor-like protein [Coriobacteriales bacterium]